MSVIEQVKELRIAAAYKEHSLKILLEQAANTIEALSAKLAEANMERSDRYYGGGWISCEDGLPEKSGEYNVTDESGKSTTLYYDKKENSWVDIGEMAMLGYPIAWQPLPEPHCP